MKTFSSQGYDNFILCAGEGIEKMYNFSNKLKKEEKWDINVKYTGADSTKSERIKLIKDLIKGEKFFLSYGDDLADISLNKLLEYHKNHGKLVTITGVKMQSPYGMIKFEEDGKINSFEEKPILNIWMNGGYMVLNKGIFKYLDKGELENRVLPYLATEGEVFMYKHTGKWKSMNTLKDNLEINELWRNGNAFWRTW